MPLRKEVAHDVQLLEARLEASNTKLELEHLRNDLRELQAVMLQYEVELKEARRLLLRQRLPRRPFCSSTERQLIAARQSWKCAGYDECELGGDAKD